MPDFIYINSFILTLYIYFSFLLGCEYSENIVECLNSTREKPEAYIRQGIIMLFLDIFFALLSQYFNETNVFSDFNASKIFQFIFGI